MPADGGQLTAGCRDAESRQLQTIFDAQLAPAVQFDDPFALDENGELLPLPAVDDRTRAQKQHDALAARRDFGQQHSSSGYAVRGRGAEDERALPDRRALARLGAVLIAAGTTAATRRASRTAARTSFPR